MAEQEQGSLLEDDEDRAYIRRVAEKRKALELRCEELEAENKRLRECEAENKQLRDAYDTLVADSEKVYAEIDHLGNQLKSVRESLASKETEIRGLQQKLADSSSKANAAAMKTYQKLRAHDRAEIEKLCDQLQQNVKTIRGEMHAQMEKSIIGATASLLHDVANFSRKAVPLEPTSCTGVEINGPAGPPAGSTTANSSSASKSNGVNKNIATSSASNAGGALFKAPPPRPPVDHIDAVEASSNDAKRRRIDQDQIEAQDQEDEAQHMEQEQEELPLVVPAALLEQQSKNPFKQQNPFEDRCRSSEMGDADPDDDFYEPTPGEDSLQGGRASEKMLSLDDHVGGTNTGEDGHGNYKVDETVEEENEAVVVEQVKEVVTSRLHKKELPAERKKKQKAQEESLEYESSASSARSEEISRRPVRYYNKAAGGSNCPPNAAAKNTTGTTTSRSTSSRPAPPPKLQKQTSNIQRDGYGASGGSESPGRNYSRPRRTRRSASGGASARKNKNSGQQSDQPLQGGASAGILGTCSRLIVPTACTRSGIMNKQAPGVVVHLSERKEPQEKPPHGDRGTPNDLVSNTTNKHEQLKEIDFDRNRRCPHGDTCQEFIATGKCPLYHQAIDLLSMQAVRQGKHRPPPYTASKGKKNYNKGSFPLPPGDPSYYDKSKSLGGKGTMKQGIGKPPVDKGIIKGSSFQAVAKGPLLNEEGGKGKGKDGKMKSGKR
ncbi:unnamed protein product [Amoebophrya sp. A25]|nr:unnamed protein product [Amoebophrya sp. A25]|eukprot:GSA25T00018344001.1